MVSEEPLAPSEIAMCEVPILVSPLIHKVRRGVILSPSPCGSSTKFVNDSSPVASVSALCNTSAGLRVVSPIHASRREEDGEDHPFGGADVSLGGLVAVRWLVLMVVGASPAGRPFQAKTAR
jgi:hypothetical protein